MDQTLQISVRHSNSCSTVRVSTRDHIGVLSTHFPPPHSSRHVMLFANQVILPGFTFAFYGVRDGSEISLIEVAKPAPPPPPSPRAAIRHFATLSQLQDRASELAQFFGYRSDGESVQRALEELEDPDVAPEAARLRDQCFTRIEGSATSNRRLMNRFASLTERSEPAPIRCAHQEMPAPTSPNCDELPVLWARQRKKPRPRK
jgi:hypothetical protein